MAPAAAQVALWAREASQSDEESDGSAAEEDEDGEGEEEGEEEAEDVAGAAGNKRKAGVNELPEARVRKPTAKAAAAAAAKPARRS